MRHLPVHRWTLWIAALGALATLAPAQDAAAAVVRGVHAIAAAAATRVIVDVDGAFRYRTHASDDRRTLFIDIDGATLAEGASRIVPVSDRRLDGVIVLDDAALRVVRVSVDFAGPDLPHMETLAEASRLVLSFADAPPDREGVGTRSPKDSDRARRNAAARRSGVVAPRDEVATAPGSTGATANRAARSSRADPAARNGASAVRPEPVANARSKVPASRFESAAAARGRAAAPDAGAATRPATARRSVLERPVVVLDPGHGGKDPGAQAWTGEYEKDIVLDLAERVARRLRKNGEVEVVMTRSGDEYVELADRRDTSRKWGADVFVSIHANASASGAARGIETYYHSAAKPGAGSGDKEVRRLARAENGGKPARDRSAARGALSRASLASGGAPAFDRRPESIRLARSVQTELVQSLGMRYETVRDLGAKEGPFFVIGDNAAPSVLVEAAFLTHREEGLRMRSEVYREQIADGVARGILAFLDEQRRDGAL